MARDVYTADMGNPPSDDDMGSIESLALRGKRRPVAGRPAPAARPNPADAGVYTADKGMPPMDDDMGSVESLRPNTDRQKKAAKAIRSAMGMKKGGCVKKMKSGGSTSTASKRADGCATKGKTKGRFV
jgi:hypothetical protein